MARLAFLVERVNEYFFAVASHTLPISMEYRLKCDTCGYDRRIDEERRAYGLAREHEAEHGEHFVLIQTPP